MRRPVAPRPIPCLALFLLAACTGLAAGPEASAVTPVPASRDSAWVRAKRALTAEVFTVDVQDSLQGRITATRYPSSSAKVGTAAACRVQLALALDGSSDGTQVASTSRWIAPEVTSDSNAGICEKERQETLDRILLVVAPAPQ
jgi:hypothetical protein